MAVRTGSPITPSLAAKGAPIRPAMRTDACCSSIIGVVPIGIRSLRISSETTNSQRAVQCASCMSRHRASHVISPLKPPAPIIIASRKTRLSPCAKPHGRRALTMPQGVAVFAAEIAALTRVLAAGAAQSAGPTSRPISLPCGSSNNVVGMPTAFRVAKSLPVGS